MDEHHKIVVIKSKTFTPQQSSTTLDTEQSHTIMQACYGKMVHFSYRFFEIAVAKT